MKGLTWSPTPSVQGPCAPRRARTGRCPEPGKETALGLHRGAPCAQRSQRGAIREAARDRGPACRAPHPRALAKAKPRRELPAGPPSSFLCPPRLPAEACPTPSPSARVARGVVGLRLCTNVHPPTWTERHACVRTSHPHRHGAGPRPQPRAAQTREQDRTRARDSSEGAQLRVAEPDTPALSPEGRCPSGAPAQGAGPGQARQGLGRHRAEQSQPEQTGGVGRGHQAPPPPPRPARSGRAPPRELVGPRGPRDSSARSFRDVGAAPGPGGEGKLQPGRGRAPELPGNSCSAPRCPPLHRPGPSAVRGQAGLLGSHCPPARSGGGRRPRCPRLPLPGAWPPGYRAGGLGDDLVRRGGHVSTFLKPLLSLGACWRGRCRHQR